MVDGTVVDEVSAVFVVVDVAADEVCWVLLLVDADDNLGSCDGLGRGLLLLLSNNNVDFNFFDDVFIHVFE